MGIPLEYRPARSDGELEQILTLQRQNVEEGLSAEEVQQQGFVTVRHDLQLLRAMNDASPHIITLDGDTVAGYALVMLRSFADRIPILQPMFAMLAELDFRGEPVEDSRFFIMGQVCVAKPYRGSGAFAGMYHAMRDAYRESYDWVITEIARRNTRSVRAHEKVGFQLLHRYPAPDGEEWDLVLWDWQSP